MTRRSAGLVAVITRFTKRCFGRGRSDQGPEGPMFPKGSETGGETAAKPEIWDNKAEFESIAKDLQSATAKAAAAAAGGLDAFKVAFGGVGKNCKSCHEKFRFEKKE